MQCSRRKRSVIGSASLLFMAVIVPFLLVMLCLGAELTHFFGAHDDIQRIVDRATRASLTKGLTSAETETLVRRELSLVDNLISVHAVHNSRRARQSDTQVEGEFRGIFSELAARLTGAETQLLPLRVSARVRKAQSRVLIVIDRTTELGADACEDESFKAVAEFADRIAGSLYQGEIEGLSMAVVPGVVRPAEMLAVDMLSDHLPRCRGRDDNNLYDASSLAGTSATISAEAAASELLAIAHNELLAGTAEGRSVVFIGQGANETLSAYAQTFLQALNADMQARQLSVLATHISLGGSEAAPIELSRSGAAGVELRTVRATPRELAHPNLVAAVRGRVGEKTVLVF